MRYFAHKAETGTTQTIEEHLNGVSGLCRSFSVDLFRSAAAAIGMAHDIGKYSEAFQNRLNGSNIKFEHSSCGAIEYSKLAANNAEKQIAPMLEYCIAGHHTGLPDGGCNADTFEDVTLHGRLKRMHMYVGKSDYSEYRNHIVLTMPETGKIIAELISSGNKTELIEKYAFFTRYLFSCLTDADFLDTERFCNPEADRRLKADFSAVSDSLDRRFAGFTADTPLKAARSRLQTQAYKNAAGSSNISILNMPTGSGKTLCSLKIALQKLLSAGSDKKRIIYVIPYTSIIEQTAELFSEIFGEYADILQHHSNYCFNAEDEEYSTAEKLKKAAENWDAPIIITTSVQFFQSLYHYRGSSLRKLHNMANSIIIFDEIHMLPINMLQPCLRGIGYITKYLNSEAVFLSATMPDYSGLFKAYIPDCTVTELITDKSDFQYFRKCSYISLGKIDFDSVILKAQEFTSSLIIVNSRKSAREIYGTVTGRKYHLSTYMTPRDRSETISSIKNDLVNGVKITVVSTSLVEAGVDLDFEAVFRQLAGLDSILQSGGRCNREGKREIGNVFIFETDEAPHGDLKIRANAARKLIRDNNDILSPECIESYYRTIFKFNEAEISANSIANETASVDGIPFRSYAERFQFIKDDTIGVVIDNCDETAKLTERLKYGDYSVKRKLQQYTVALKIHNEFDQALSLGIIDDFGTGVYVLTSPDYYSSETGLDISRSFDKII